MSIPIFFYLLMRTRNSPLFAHLDSILASLLEAFRGGGWRRLASLCLWRISVILVIRNRVRRLAFYGGHDIITFLSGLWLRVSWFSVFLVALFVNKYIPLYVIEENLFFWVIVRRNTHYKFIEEQSEKIPVNSSWMSLFGQDLGC